MIKKAIILSLSGQSLTKNEKKLFKLHNQLIKNGVDLVSEEKEEERFLVPKEIKETLDDYVISQEEAKKNLSVAVYNHYKRLREESRSNEKDEIP